MVHTKEKSPKEFYNQNSARIRVNWNWFYKYIGISIWKNDDTLLATGIIFN